MVGYCSAKQFHEGARTDTGEMSEASNAKVGDTCHLYRAIGSTLPPVPFVFCTSVQGFLLMQLTGSARIKSPSPKLLPDPLYVRAGYKHTASAFLDRIGMRCAAPAPWGDRQSFRCRRFRHQRIPCRERPPRAFKRQD